MPTESKAKAIEEIREAFSKTTIGIVTDYRGLPTSELNSLRRKLGEAGIQYKVVKNTLARIAAEKVGRAQIAKLFQGPVAVALGHGDIVEPPRILLDHIRTTKSNLAIKGGFLNSRPLTPADITTISTLPPRDTLIAQVLAGFQSPISSMVNVLSNPMRGMLGILQARVKQLEVK